MAFVRTEEGTEAATRSTRCFRNTTERSGCDYPPGGGNSARNRFSAVLPARVLSRGQRTATNGRVCLSIERGNKKEEIASDQVSIEEDEDFRYVQDRAAHDESHHLVSSDFEPRCAWTANPRAGYAATGIAEEFVN